MGWEAGRTYLEWHAFTVPFMFHFVLVLWRALLRFFPCRIYPRVSCKSHFMNVQLLSDLSSLPPTALFSFSCVPLMFLAEVSHCLLSEIFTFVWCVSKCLAAVKRGSHLKLCSSAASLLWQPGYMWFAFPSSLFLFVFHLISVCSMTSLMIRCGHSFCNVVVMICYLLQFFCLLSWI